MLVDNRGFTVFAPFEKNEFEQLQKSQDDTKI